LLKKKNSATAKSVDLLICSLPAGIINRPPAAPAILKGCVEQQGFTAVTVDLSLEFFINQCNESLETYTQHSTIFEPLVDFDKTSESYCVASQWLNHCIDIIKSHNPKFLGLSVFSYFQHRATVLLCDQVRRHCPDIKIILGGYGLAATTRESFQGFISKEDNSTTFDTYMSNKNLSDFQIHGEGENSIVEILEKNSIQQTPVDLMNVPTPNFDNYFLDKYQWHDVPVLTITGSKGCVRACTFCNVPAQFGRYRRRSGAHIAAEMIELQKKYSVNKFEFTDSLVNGSQKDFFELITILAEHNESAEPGKKITWYGQYICRPQSQVIEGTYPLMKRSGALNLVIGAESGSNEVLEAMNKKITVQDLYDEIEQFKQHNLQAQLLVLIGFYNETWPRFLETLDFLVKCQPYVANNTITRIAPGMPLVIDDRYLYHNAENLGIEINAFNSLDWRTKHDSSNTWLERIKRKIIVQLILHQMQLPMTSNGISETKTMIEQLKIYEQQLRSFDSGANFSLSKFQPH
jgi:radical SAM superfamily enzyme YgiQ (UPF0313 family)